MPAHINPFPVCFVSTNKVTVSPLINPLKGLSIVRRQGKIKALLASAWFQMNNKYKNSQRSWCVYNWFCFFRFSALLSAWYSDVYHWPLAIVNCFFLSFLHYKKYLITLNIVCFLLVSCYKLM